MCWGVVPPVVTRGRCRCFTSLVSVFLLWRQTHRDGYWWRVQMTKRFPQFFFFQCPSVSLPLLKPEWHHVTDAKSCSGPVMIDNIQKSAEHQTVFLPADPSAPSRRSSCPPFTKGPTLFSNASPRPTAPPPLDTVCNSFHLIPEFWEGRNMRRANSSW